MDNDILIDGDSPQAQAKQATLREMARRSQDRIRVYNPLLEDFTVRFDSIGFVVPGRTKDNGHGLGTAVLLRYVAENYRTHMIDKILNDKMDEAVNMENKRRADLGMLPMTKFIGGEELSFCNALKTDNTEERKRLLAVIWLGIAERYGIESREESISGKPKDDRPMDERLTEELERRGPVVTYEPPTTLNMDTITTTTVTPQVLDNLKTKDVFTLRKIAREKGIETEKTDKKDDLIAKISA